MEDCLLIAPVKGKKWTKKILAKSGGYFLLVRLVLQVLENIYDDTTIETVLEEMPAEINDFYTRTVNLMSVTVPTVQKDIAKAILKVDRREHEAPQTG